MQIPRLDLVARVMYRPRWTCAFEIIRITLAPSGLMHRLQTVTWKLSTMPTTDMIAAWRSLRNHAVALSGEDEARSCKTTTFDMPTGRLYAVKKNTVIRLE